MELLTFAVPRPYQILSAMVITSWDFASSSLYDQ